MANPLKGEVDIVASGKTWTICLTSNAIVSAEHLLDKSIGEIVDNLSRYEYVRALLWAGLQKNHDGVDLAGAGDLIDEYEGGAQGLIEPLARAVRFRLSRTAIDEPFDIRTKAKRAVAVG